MNRSEPSIKLAEFAGLNNKAEPRVLPPNAFTTAVNIDLDDARKIRRRRPYAELLPVAGLTALWATPDESRAFAIIDGILYELVGDTPDLIALRADVGDGEAYWDWDGSRVFVSLKGGDLVVDGKTVMPLTIPRPAPPRLTLIDGDLPAGRYLVAAVNEDIYGRQSGASDLVPIVLEAPGGIQIEPQAASANHAVRLFVTGTNGSVLHRLYGAHYRDLEQMGEPLDGAQYNAVDGPAGGPVAFHAGRLWKAMPFDGTTVVTPSQPFWHHLFAYGPESFQVQGTPTGLAEAAGALLIGTSAGIWRYHIDEGLAQIAHYGMPGGQPIVKDKSEVAYFWTNRGLCRAFPFENLTDTNVSAAPGARCAVGIVEEGGFSRVVAVTGLSPGVGDRANNPR